MTGVEKQADELVKLDGKKDVHVDVQARIASYKRVKADKSSSAAKVNAHAGALVRAARTLDVKAPKAAKKSAS